MATKRRNQIVRRSPAKSARFARALRAQRIARPASTNPKDIGAPGRIRTHDPQIRSLVLYPAELPVLASLRSSLQALGRPQKGPCPPQLLMAGAGEIKWWSSEQGASDVCPNPEKRRMHLGSAKMRSTHGLGPAHHLPENAASLASLPLGPVLRRGFGFSAPQPPGVLMKRPGQ